MNDVVAAFGLFAEPFAVEMEASASDEELLHSLEKAAQKALIYVSIDCEGMYATLVTPWYAFQEAVSLSALLFQTKRTTCLLRTPPLFVL